MTEAQHHLTDFQIGGESFGRLLSTYRKISIPAYQRSYDWTEKEWADLWSDLVESAPVGREYFMGPLNAERLMAGDGIQLADGQQRITTLSILLSALKIKVPEEQANAIDAYLFVEASAGQAGGRKPRLNDQGPEGDEAIRKVLDRNSVIPPDEVVTRHDRAYNYFCLRLNAVSDQLASQLFEFITKKLIFARVVAQESGSGIKMFERSNTRGRPLTLTDKLKSLLIGSAQLNEAHDVIANWSKSVEKLRSVKKYDDRRFVDWLATDYGDEEKMVRASDALDLARRVVSEDGAWECSVDLVEYCSAVASIWSGYSPVGHRELGSLFNLQNYSRFSQLMRILPACRTLSEDNFAQLAESVENTVCVVAIAKAFPPDIEKLMPGLLKTCREIRDGQSDFRELLQSLRSIRDTYAQPFGDRIVNGVRGDFKQKSHLLVVWGLMDQYMVNVNRNKNARLPRQRVKLGDISIEHILPKSPSAKVAAKEYGVQFAGQDRERIANLTPLENGLNYGTEPFSVKSKSYVNSNFVLTSTMSTKYANAGLKVFREMRMKYLPPYKRWDRSQLENRASRLQGLACVALDLKFEKVEIRPPDRPTLESVQLFPRVSSFRALANSLQLFVDGGRPLAKDLSTLRFIGLIEDVDGEDVVTELGESLLVLSPSEQVKKIRDSVLEVPYVAMWIEMSMPNRKELIEEDVKKIAGKPMPLVTRQILTCLNAWVGEKVR